MRRPNACESASDIDKWEDEYYHAVAKNNRLRKLRDAGCLSEEGYQFLRNEHEDDYSEGISYERRRDSLS